jgi:hypothetical protein
MTFVLSLTGLEPAIVPLGGGSVIQLRHRDQIANKICNKNLQQKFATKICNKNLQQKFATKICNKNLQQKFATKICRLPGSNRGPSDLQSDALPTELKRQFVCFCQNLFARHFCSASGIRTRACRVRANYPNQLD